MTIAIGSSQTYAVGGGTGLIRQLGNAGVADALLVVNNLKVTAITAGSASIVIQRQPRRDKMHGHGTIDVPTPFVLLQLQTNVTIAVARRKPMLLVVELAHIPQHPAIQAAMDAWLSGNSLKVTGVTAGSNKANVVVRDSQGATIIVAVTVPAAATIPLFTTAPSNKYCHDHRKLMKLVEGLVPTRLLPAM